jgi:hypothetical protein
MPQLGCGHNALVDFAEPAEAVPRDDAVGPVTQRTRNDDQGVRERPGESQVTRDPQRSVGLAPQPVAFDQQDAVRKRVGLGSAHA